MLPAGVKKKLGDALYFISFVFNKECVREHFMSRIACIDAPGALHHINPIRTGHVAEVALLDRYPFCGHSVVLGKKERAWQDDANVLTDE